MARTYRHRRAAPKGVRYCDGGRVYREGEGLIRPRRRPDSDWQYKHGADVSEELWTDFLWVNKERKDERKKMQRQFRARIRQQMHREQWDTLCRWRKTQGWLTW